MSCLIKMLIFPYLLPIFIVAPQTAYHWAWYPRVQKLSGSISPGYHCPYPGHPCTPSPLPPVSFKVQRRDISWLGRLGRKSGDLISHFKTFNQCSFLVPPQTWPSILYKASQCSTTHCFSTHTHSQSLPHTTTTTTTQTSKCQLCSVCSSGLQSNS